MGIPSNKHALLSKMATSNGHGENSPYFDGWKAYECDPFHPTKNPQGVIQMGLAENQLCYDLIEEWIKEHPQASFCTNEGDEFKDAAFFQDYHGLPTFRRAIAKFMGRVRGNKATFNPDNIVMSSGATGAVETVTFCLADPGDAFLIPSPYYPGFNRDICWRTGVQLIPIPCDSSNKFSLTIDALESTYKKAREESFNVKGLLLNNPSNPLGTILDRGTLKDILTFIREMNIHLVCDEIYAATVFNQPDFISISEVLEERGDYNKDLVHIIYGLSKDMGLPGFRIGIIYSYNDHVISCARKMSSFGLISTQTQHLIASMLYDDDFVERFLSESAKRLALRHKVLTQMLFRLGVGILKSNSGLFLWMDLGVLMKERTEEEEVRLWLEIIDKVKLNISPGLSFKCCEPGWFRVCFANMDDATMEIALQRIQSFLLKQKDVKD